MARSLLLGVNNTCWREVQFSKAFLCMDNTCEGSVMESNEMQFANVHGLMEGMVASWCMSMEAKAVQPKKAYLDSLVRLGGMLMEVRDEHSKNASSPMMDRPSPSLAILAVNVNDVWECEGAGGVGVATVAINRGAFVAVAVFVAVVDL
mmetsp:Transcript_17996/g.20507  ORF Transcript_17996/g.20507 Transcript_17996/m.20507 type:complete len:149 (+) Transcript_17996:1294-1740(+)